MAMGFSLKKIASIFLLIMVMIILGYVLLIQLYPQAADKTTPFVNSAFKLLNKGLEKISKEKIPGDVEDMFSYLVEDLNKETTTTNCLLTHKNFVKDLEGYTIRFDNSNDETKAYLMKKNNPVNEFTINKKICVIHPTNFYDNYLEKKSCSPNCGSNYKEVDIIEIRDNRKIYFDGKEHELKDQNLMFKADEEHICFFPTKTGGFLGIGNAGCTAYEDTIKAKCINEIPNKIDICK